MIVLQQRDQNRLFRGQPVCRLVENHFDSAARASDRTRIADVGRDPLDTLTAGGVVVVPESGR
jgi:hypothetical protein